MPIYEILSAIKQKQLSNQEINLLLSKMRERNLTSIPLWRASTITRLTTATARMQGYMVIIAGLLFIPAAIYDKYQQDPSKIYRLAVYTPIATLFVLAPILLYRRSVKRILTQISYDVEEKAFSLQTYQKQTLKIFPKDLTIVCNPKKPKVIHEISVASGEKEARVFKMEGYGEWESSQLFRFIVEKKGLDQQII